MPRLIHVASSMLERPRLGRKPVLASWRPSRPHDPAPVEPWFELTSQAPLVDTRVAGAEGVGVAAALATTGGVTGPDVGSEGAGDRADVVIGGNPVRPGTPPSGNSEEFTRQCTIRVSVTAEEVGPGRQCLMVLALRGMGPDGRATIQTLVGVHSVSEDVIVGDDRLAVLVDGPDDGTLAFDLRVRLCGHDSSARLGLRGVAAYLL